MAPPPRSLRSGLAAVAMALLVAACSPAARGTPAAPPANAPVADAAPAQQLRDAVRTDAAMAHLRALQGIADAHGGNRAAGTAGYDASVDYVVGELKKAGFDVATPSYAASADADTPAPGRNVVAQTRGGDPNRVVMIGAHLDSVPAGPGVVDDGSGVATLLEIAGRLGAEPATRATVRFAFFGSEEEDAQGSAGYVESLSADEIGRIALYLNVDMVASPNGGYLVQGGKGDDEDAVGPPGSATVATVLVDQLTRAGAAAPEVIEFPGDDEAAFIDAGIPVGGAENGDAEKKTVAQATAWGGKAGEVYDPCYHQACDRIDNVDREVLDRYLRGLAGTVAYFATSTDAVR